MQKSGLKKLMILFSIAFFMLSFFSINAVFCASSATAEQSSSSTTAEGELASEYFLYNTTSSIFPENVAGLTANVENQYQSDLCWAFSSITALETTLYKTGLVDKNANLNFSELDLAYNVFVTSRGWDSLGGGAFEVAYEYFSSDSGPVDEQSWETQELEAYLAWISGSGSELVDYYTTGLTTNQRLISGYSALESYFFPSRESIEFYDNTNGVEGSVTEAKILTNRNNIKNHIQTYGAVTASMYINNTYFSNDIYYYCGNTIPTSNHMITLVGWDDDVMSNGHTGAYIAQNSSGEGWGNGGFFYIFYDDEYIEDNVCGFTRVGENLTDYIEYDNMSSSGYENQFVTFDSSHTVYNTSWLTYANTVYFANIYKIDQSFENQYISRIKVPTVCVEKNVFDASYQNNDATTFRVYVLNGLTSNQGAVLNTNFGTKIPVINPNATTGDAYLFSSNQTGYYTIELAENIRLTGGYFAIIFQVEDGNSFYMRNNSTQSISIATYVSQEPSTSWVIYDGGSTDVTKECVLPMKIQTYVLDNMTYSVAGGTYTYDGQPHNPIVSVTTPSSPNVTYSLDGINYSSDLPNLKDVRIDAGNVLSYTVFVKITAEYYHTVEAQVEIRINPKSLSITPTPVTSVYGSVYNRPMWVLTGLVPGESVNSSGVLSVDNFNTSGLNNVGEYNIIRNTLILSNKNNFFVSNYAISFVEGVKYTVTPKTLYVVPNELTKNYGDADPSLTYHFFGAQGTQNPNILATLEREIGENVGEYVISLSGIITETDDVASGFYASNYNTVFTADPCNFSIIPRVLTITPNVEQSKIYGDDEPSLTFTILNPISGETPAFTGSLSRILGEDAGYYQITIGSLDLADNSPFLAQNYTLEISSETVHFRILSGIITDSFVTDINVSYSGVQHFLNPDFGEEDDEYTVRYSEVLSTSDTFNEATASTQNIGKTNVGTYYICFEFSKENYAPKYETAKITILPIDLNVAPNEGQSKTYGESDSIFFSFSGQISTEIPAFMGNLSRQSGENVGNYIISQGTLTLDDNETFLANNYTLVFENIDGITYEITKRMLTIIPNDGQSKFYGKNDPVLTFTGVGYAFSDTADFTGLLSRESGENVGEYSITVGTLALAGSLSSNYNFELDTAEHLFEITAVGVKIKIINLKNEYGSLLINYYGETSFNTVSYEFEDGTEVHFVDGDNLELEYLCYEDETTLISPYTLAGNYEITAVSHNSNYRVSVSEGSRYTITYRTYVVTFIIEENSVIRTNSVTHFDPVGALPDGIDENPIKAGYTFKNWKKSIDDVNWTTVGNIGSEIIECNTKFKAYMELNSYRIYYNLNGGSVSGTAPTSFTILTNTFSLINPTKEGYDFMGYFESSDFSGEPVTQIAQGSTGNLTLFAKWQIKTFSITIPLSNVGYTITALTETTPVNYGNDYTFEINLSSAYNKSYATMKVCVIWQSTSNEAEISPQQIVTNDEDGVKNRYIISNVRDDFEITISDVVINVYQINFIADENVVETINLTHGGSLLFENFPEIPVKEFFDETDPVWNVTTNIINVSQDQNITANYTPNVYTVTFLMDDGKEISVQTTYGSTVDTSVLEDEYKLNMFEYFIFAKPLTGVSSNEDIRVTIASNIHVFYTVVASIVALILLSVAVSIVRKRHRHQARSSAYNKINKAEYQANLEKYRNEYEKPDNDNEKNRK